MSFELCMLHFSVARAFEKVTSFCNPRAAVSVFTIGGAQAEKRDECNDGA